MLERLKLILRFILLSTRAQLFMFSEDEKEYIINGIKYYMFLNAVRSFMEMENLTAPLAKELIDHIDVYESEGKGKNKTQRIVIYYRFVGYIELPDKIPIVNDTRQGVAMNYISGTLPETA